MKSEMSTHSPANAALSIHTDEDFRVLERARLRALVDSGSHLVASDKHSSIRALAIQTNASNSVVRADVLWQASVRDSTSTLDCLNYR
jgi:hypothetical protein